MQKVINRWLMLGLSLGVFASCSQEGNEPNSVATGGGETVVFSLSAEASLDDSSPRSIDYKLGTNKNGKLVPMPQFTDGQAVEVHTILKSSRGTQVAKTLTWHYDASGRKLILKPEDGHSITVSGFNNDNSTKWYISGLIGGALKPGTTQVSFEGVRELRAVDGSEGDIVGSLNVPYSFGWTELSIDKTSPRDGNNSHLYAKVLPGVAVKFSPRGSLVAYKFGNDLLGGAYTFTPDSFMVNSSVWSDQGTFELNTDIPTSNAQSVMPKWSEAADSLSLRMVYSFAPGHKPGVIPHKSVSSKTYYAWVISLQGSHPRGYKQESDVALLGKSSRPETADIKDYTNVYATMRNWADPNQAGYDGGGRLIEEGKVHSYIVKARYPYFLPIQYVTDYNLAGGHSVTSTTTGLKGTYYGALRFAENYNNHSGYYHAAHVDDTFTRASGPKPPSAPSDNIFSQMKLLPGTEGYTLPDVEQWRGIFPGARNGIVISRSFAGAQNVDEFMSVGENFYDYYRQSYKSDYSQGFTNSEGDDVVYAIRFKARGDLRYLKVPMPTSPSNAIGHDYYRTYPSAQNDRFKCAYRFTRLGNHRADSVRGTLVIDVAYLGVEDTPTNLSDVSDESWWAQKKSAGLLITKVFPATGILYTPDDFGMSGGILREYGATQYYLSSMTLSQSHPIIRSTYTEYYANSKYYYVSPDSRYPAPVRPFRHLYNK